jgi:cytochrome b
MAASGVRNCAFAVLAKLAVRVARANNATYFIKVILILIEGESHQLGLIVPKKFNRFGFPRALRMQSKGPGMKKVRIWDLPTRLFHWALVICFIGLFITAKTGGSAMTWHFRIGYSMASLLLFRAVWGFIGGRWSRFTAFIYGPRSTVAYLRGQAPPEHSMAHNPMGALSVYAMLFFLIAQVSTGLFSEDKGEVFGPLSMFVSSSTVRLVSGYHKNVGQLLLLLLVSMHLGAIAFYYFWQKNNLVKPMIVGDKLLPGNVAPSRDDTVSHIVGAIVLAVCAVAIGWIVRLGG